MFERIAFFKSIQAGEVIFPFEGFFFIENNAIKAASLLLRNVLKAFESVKANPAPNENLSEAAHVANTKRFLNANSCSKVQLSVL